MQLTTILDLDHAILRKKARKIALPLCDEIRQFLKQMQTFISTLESPYGVPGGLAAPQVGYDLAIIFMQIPEEAKQRRNDCFDVLPLTAFLNPRYIPIDEKGLSKDWEACYSVPGKIGQVYRYNSIRFEADLMDGSRFDKILSGFFARLAQHETDHIHGILYPDLITDDCLFENINDIDFPFSAD